MLGAILSALFAGFVIGSLARLAIPGPDPMPFSLTVAVGLVGSAVGVGIAAALYGGGNTFDTSSHAFVTLLLEVGAAIALVAAYRRFVQKRPLWGPEARRFPERGLGIARMRARLQKLGIDPDRLQRRGATTSSQRDADSIAEELEQLRAKRDAGTISAEEYEQARERLRRY